MPVTDYLSGVTGGPRYLVFLFVFLPSSFLTSDEVVGLAGESPGLAGEATGEAAGLAVTAGTGVAAGFSGTLTFGSQAPNTATLAAKTVDNINDLLIVFLLIGYCSLPRLSTSYALTNVRASATEYADSGPQHRHPQPE